MIDITTTTFDVLMAHEDHQKRVKSLLKISKDVAGLTEHLRYYGVEVLRHDLESVSDLARQLLVVSAEYINWHEIALELWCTHYNVDPREALGLESSV